MLFLRGRSYNELGQLVDKNLHSTDGTTFSTSFYDKEAGMNVNVNVDISYNLVDNIDQVKDNQNVLFIVDDVEPKKGDKEGGNPVGRATFEGQVAAVEGGYVVNTTNGSSVQHEQGHNLGLNFSDNSKDPVHSKDANHLMYKNVGGKNINASDLKTIWQGWGQAGDGKYYAGKGKARENAKDFIQSGYKINDEKRKKAGL